MRAHSNVLCIGTTVCQSKHSITLLEAAFTLIGQFLDYTTEFDTESLGSLGRERVVAFALEQVHAVETKGFDADEGLSGGGSGAFDLVDEEGGGWTFAILDVCMDSSLDGCLLGNASVKLELSEDVPTARMLTIVTVVLLFRGFSG
jgi:hypothetical protein